MTDSFERLDAARDEIIFPQSFLERYEVIERLAYGRGTETFLTREKDGGKNYIAKRYDRGVYPSVGESEILKSLSHQALPVFAGEYANDDCVCVVREYIEGLPLDKYMDSRPLPSRRAVSIAMELCDILTYLHGRVPQVIHRDIKPQNVIVRPDGSAALIDFDIARTYDADETEDTRVVGTRAFAPPEQYGFAQTDCRTDIYSLGVLLCFMLTGQTDLKTARIGDKRLSAVVRRCASFAPETRFQTSAEVKRALRRSNGGVGRKLARVCAACLAAIAIWSAGFAAGRYTDILTAPRMSATTPFGEETIERAVRAQLGKSPSESLTPDELALVRGIYAFGNEVFDSYEAFSGDLSLARPRGNISSLEDLALLTGLETLCLSYQKFDDLSPLRSLVCLRDVNIRETFVSDVSPLADLPGLEYARFAATNVSDVTALANCPRLKWLDLGYSLVRELSAVPDIKNLSWLSLRSCRVRGVEGIGRLSNLEYLNLCGTDVKDLRPVLELSELKELVVDESMRGSVESLGETRFSVTYEEP